MVADLAVRGLHKMRQPYAYQLSCRLLNHKEGATTNARCHRKSCLSQLVSPRRHKCERPKARTSGRHAGTDAIVFVHGIY
jgi:hypothetical protein